VSAARNRGFQESDPERPFLTWIDADDVWEPFALQMLFDKISIDAKAAGAYGLARYIDKHGNPVELGSFSEFWNNRKGIKNRRLVELADDEPTTFIELIYSNCIPSSAGMIRKSKITWRPLFDESLVISEDWFVWLQLSLRGHFILVNDVLLNYRFHDENASKNIKKLGESDILVRKKIFSSLDISLEQKKIAGLAWKYRQRDMIAYRFSWMQECVQKRKYIKGLMEIKHILNDIYISIYKYKRFPFLMTL
jgi:glycosyltransferase involved in cell wall biosynthesis